MARQPAADDARRPGIVNRGGAQTIETENGFVARIVDRKERLRTSKLVALTGVTAQEFVQRFLAAVERFPIMFLADRLFVPCRQDRYRFGNARAAARSLRFGAGGCSSKSRTRKLSLSESRTWSASSMTAIAARKA